MMPDTVRRHSRRRLFIRQLTRRPTRGLQPSRSLLLAGVFLLAGGTALSGCAALAGTEETSGTVVVTTNILGDVTENITRGQADVVVLMEPGADPHSFGISARQAAQLESADLIIYNGLGLEEGILRHVSAAEDQGVAVLAVGDAVDPLPFAANAGTPTDTGTPAAPDPHFWTDPLRMAEAAGLIADAVAAHVPSADPAAVHGQAEAYAAQLRELDAWMAAEFAGIPSDRRSLVTNHHVFGYLASRYGFTITGALIPGGTTLASPSSADLDDLAGKIRAASVPAIFTDSSQPDRLAQVLAEEAGLDVAVVGLFTESLGTGGSGADTYLEMMRTNTGRITSALSR